MKKHIAFLSFVAVTALTVLYISGCKKTDLAIGTTSDVNIVGYFDNNPDSFSLFRQILERTETAAYLNAYGAYTCFAPTNSGVKNYLAALGAASVDAADLNTLKDMVRLHLLEDTVTTNAFTDGKLPVITMYGQYLITSVSNKAGISSYIINRQASITKSNIMVGNGIIQQIDQVLRPATKSIAQQLESNPDYSLFVQAMKETGFYDLLNTKDNPDPSKKWLTVLAESNKALADSGINSYADLKTRYSQTNNPANPKDSLNLYMAYHILSGIKFLGDIIIAPSHATFAPQEVVSSKLINQDVVLNEDVFNGVLEPGVHLGRNNSDNTATNGVWHDASAHFTLKFRKPTALYWDVSDFTEIRKLPAYFRKQNYAFRMENDADQPIKDIIWPYTSASTTLTYQYSTTSGTSNYACNNDINILPLGGPARTPWVEYTTPTIVKGKYKVWICYRQQKQSSSSNIQSNVLIDGVLMQRPFSFTETKPNGSDGELEAIGWKRYIQNTSSSYAGRLVGTVDIKTTERHVLRIQVISGTQNTNNLDMIHFIPVDENQILPRFLPNGNKLYE